MSRAAPEPTSGAGAAHAMPAPSMAELLTWERLAREPAPRRALESHLAGYCRESGWPDALVHLYDAARARLRFACGVLDGRSVTAVDDHPYAHPECAFPASLLPACTDAVARGDEAVRVATAPDYDQPPEVAAWHRGRSHVAVATRLLRVHGRPVAWLTLAGSDVGRPAVHAGAEPLVWPLAVAARLAAAVDCESECLALAERMRAVSECHDALAQTFAAIVVQLRAGEAWSGAPAAASLHVHHAQSLAHEGLTEARRSVLAVRPPALADLGLRDALGALAGWARTARALDCRFVDGSGPAPLAAPVEAVLYAVARVAVAAAVADPSTARILIVLSREDTGLALMVEDDGRPAAGIAPRWSGPESAELEAQLRPLHGRLSIACTAEPPAVRVIASVETEQAR